MDENVMLIPIGQFSKLVRLSVKALRLYDERGLLVPCHIDPETGYRYYRPAQAKRAEIIRILRSVEMSLDAIQEVLDADSTTETHELLVNHRQRMEERLEMQERMLIYLESLIENKERIMPYDITVTHTDSMLVAGTRMRTTINSIKSDVPKGFAIIMQGIMGKQFLPVGPPMLVYHDVIDEENDGDIEICIPIQKECFLQGDIRCHTFEAGKVAMTVHHGPYEELSSAYHSMLAWVTENGYELVGPPREIYLNDPREVGPEQLQTKLEFPVAKGK